MATRLITLPVDEEIAASGFSDETLASFVHIGFTLYKHHVTKKLNDLVEGNIDDIVQQRFQEQLHALKKENIDVVQKHDLAMKHQQLSLAHTTEVIQQLKDERRELQSKMDALYQTIYVDSVQKLKDDIKQKEMEISMLRNTNAVKGMVGEASIAEELRRTFADCEVGHTGKTAHACDLHMKLGGGPSTVVFESKYKSCIDKRDVDKFIRDVKQLRNTMPSDLLGAVFVSMVSANIPHKGSLSFEYIEGLPVMYVAYDDEATFKRDFGKHVKMFIPMCQYLKEHSVDDASDACMAQDILEDIKFLQGMMVKNKKRMDDLKGRFQKYTHDAEEDNRCMMDRLETALNRLPSKRKTRRKTHQETTP